MAALIGGMVGCTGDGYNPPPSQNLEIRTWYDLDAVRDNLAGNHTLMNDLDSTTLGYEELASPTANGGKGWQPIGIHTPHGATAYVPFTGALDGQGYEIRDLRINRPDEDSSVGLFMYVTHAVIEDVGVTNVTVIGRDEVGALAGGIKEGSVSRSYSSGNVTGNDDVGGLVGRADCILTDCRFAGTVTGYEYVGGLAGQNFNTVGKCRFTGNVTGNSSVGGLVGASWDGPVSDSYSSGRVTGYGRVGGLVGWNSGSISNCHSGSDINGVENVGGLVGENGYYICGTVNNSYSTGSITGTSYVGGLVGTNGCNVTDSFWDVQTSGRATSAGGTGMNTTEMKDIATFSGATWNIIAVALNETNPVYIWNIVNNVTYPFLSWQA